MPAEPTDHASVFAALHRGGRPFVLPNAWDVASALFLEEAAFPAIGTTSLGVTAAAGLPDGHGDRRPTGREATVALSRLLAGRLSVPLTVDVEGGHSDDPGAVADLAAQLADLGVAGINIEDGRSGGGLRPVAEQASIIRAVTGAVPGLFVNARTDVWWLEAGASATRLDETVRRLAAYGEAGASGVFVPGLRDTAQIATVARAVRLPLNVLWWPEADLDRLGAAGVARVSTGSALYRHALAAALTAADAARTGGCPPGAVVTYEEVQWLVAGTDHATAAH